jgi:hypothetical protein
MNGKVSSISPALKRELQAGIVSLHGLMARLLEEFALDLRTASTVTLTVPHPRHKEGIVRIHGTSAAGGQVGDFTLPVTMTELNYGESWGLAPTPSKETGDDEGGEGGEEEGRIVV